MKKIKNKDTEQKNNYFVNHKFAICSFIAVVIMCLIVISVRYKNEVRVVRNGIEAIVAKEVRNYKQTEDYNNIAGNIRDAVSPSSIVISAGGLNLREPAQDVGQIMKLQQAAHSYDTQYEGCWPKARLFCMNAERISGVVRTSTGWKATTESSVDFSNYSIDDLRDLLDKLGIAYGSSDGKEKLKKKVQSYYASTSYSAVDPQEGKINGTIYEKLTVKYVVKPEHVKKPENPKDQYEIEFIKEEYKKDCKAKVDGLVGYAKWQLEMQNEIRPEQFQQIIWMSGYIEKKYGSGEDKQAYASMSDNSYRGVATSYGNGDGSGNTGVTTNSGTTNGLNNNCVESHFLNKNTNLYNSDVARRAFQYDICYDTIFNNIKTYYKGDINLDGNKFSAKDEAALNTIIDKANKNKYISQKEISEADLNGDGKITNADLEEYKKLKNQNANIENDGLKTSTLLKAEVDNKTAQTMVDQDDRSFLIGPYNVNIKVDKQMLAKTTGNQDTENNQNRKYKNGDEDTLIYSGTPNNILIKELLKTNPGQNDQNTFAELDNNKIKITVVDADGNVVPTEDDNYTGSLEGPSVYFVNEDGERITNNTQILKMMLKGEYFFLKMKFYNPNVYYKEYTEQYLKYLGGFSIHVSFGLKYIDQFYMNRAEYEYSESVSHTYKTLHYEGEYVYDYTQLIKMVRELLGSKGENLYADFYHNFEKKQAEKEYTVEKYDNKYTIKIEGIQPREYGKWCQTKLTTVSYTGIDFPNNATIYGKTKYGGWIVKQKQKREVDAVDKSYWKGTNSRYFSHTDSGTRYNAKGEVVPGTPEGNYFSSRTYVSYYTDGDITSASWKDDGDEVKIRKEADLDEWANKVDPSSDSKVKHEENATGSKPNGSSSSYKITQVRYVYTWHQEMDGTAHSDILYYFAEEGDGSKFLNSTVTVDNAIEDNSMVPMWRGSPSLHTRDCYAIKWLEFQYHIYVDSVMTVGGGTVTSSCGKLTVQTHVDGYTVPVSNEIYKNKGYAPWFYQGDSDSGEFSGNITVKDNNKWQDFMYITDIRYTRNHIGVDIKFSTKNNDKYSEDEKVITAEADGPMIQIGGKVWIDKEASSKLDGGVFENVNDAYNKNRDKLYEGIEVTLHEMIVLNNASLRGMTTGDLQEIQTFTTITNSNGEYQFLGLNPFSKYYVTFKYNGQIYQPSFYSTNEKDKLRRNKAEDGGATYNSYIENKTDKDIAVGYSNAKELEDERNALNGRLVKIDSDAEQYENLEAIRDNEDNYDNSGNYKSSVTNKTNRAYGLNERIVNSAGDFIAGGDVDSNNDRGDYYRYGLQKNNSSTVSTNGNDGVLTYGDLYNRFREIISAESASKAAQENHDAGVVTVKITYDENHKPHYDSGYGNINYEDAKDIFLNEIKNTYNIKDDEATKIWNYILDTNINATTSKNYIDKTSEVISKSTLNVVYPKYDYYICEDVTRSTLIKVSQGNSEAYSNAENPYKLLAVAQKTSADDPDKIEEVKYHFTLLGTVVNAPDSNTHNRIQEISCSNFNQGLDYLYTEGTKNNSRLPGAQNDTATGQVTKKFPDTGDWRNHDASCIKNAVDYAMMVREIADVHIDKDVNQIITTVNGQKTTYQYRKKNLEQVDDDVNGSKRNTAGGVAAMSRDRDGTLTVVQKARKPEYNGTLVYNREIRTADYLYDEKIDEGINDDAKNLEVYIQYVIAVENTGDVDVVFNNILDYYENDTMEFDRNDLYCKDKEYTYYTRYDFEKKEVINYDLTNNLQISDAYRNLYSENDDGTSNYNYRTVNKLELVDGNSIKDERVKVGETAYYYITYKVKKEHFKLSKDENNPDDTDYDRVFHEYKINNKDIQEQIKVLMDQNFNCEIIRAGKRCLAEVGSYSTYYPTGREIPNEGTGTTTVSGKAAGLVDIDSNPGNLRNKDLYQNKDDVDQTYPTTELGNNISEGKDMSYIGTLKIYDDITKTRAEDDIDQAPTTNLIYPNKDSVGQLRTIRGNVFEDLRKEYKDNQATLGNGEYNEDKEQLIAGVTVQLVELLTDVDKNTNIVSDIRGERIVTYKTYKFDEGEISTTTGFIDDKNPEPAHRKAEIIKEDSDRYFTSTGEKDEHGELIYKEKVIRNIFDIDGNDVATTITPKGLNRGEYSFVNIPAGYYYVRFIYGDNHQTVLTKEITVDDDNKALDDNQKAKANQVYNLFNDEYVKANITKETINKDGSLRRASNGNEITETLEGFNTKSYNGQDYKSAIYTGNGSKIGDYGIQIGNNKTIYEYDGSKDDNEATQQGYDANGDAKQDIRIVSNIDGRLFAIDRDYSYNNGSYAGSMYALDKALLRDNAQNNKNTSVAKDVWAYRERANDFARGYDYFGNGETETEYQVGSQTKHGDETLRNYRSEILSSPSKLLTFRSMNISKSEYEKEYDLSKLSENKEELMELAREQKEALFELEYHTQMVAQTGIIDLTGENIDRDDSNNELIFDAKNITINNYELKNVSLGLQERPKAQLKLEHEIVNFKLMSENQPLIDTAETQNNLMSFGKHLEHKIIYKNNSNNRLLKRAEPRTGAENGLEAVTPELDDELLAQAKVEITYNLKVTNVGEIDYTDREFYNTGNERDIKNNIVKTAAYTVVDYPTNGLVFEEENQYKYKNSGKSIWSSATGIRVIPSNNTNPTTTITIGENINANINNYNQHDIKEDDIPNSLIMLVIPEANEANITNEYVKEQLKQEYKDYQAQTELEDAYYHGDQHTHPSYSFDLVNRNYAGLLMTYDTILETNALGNNLVPDMFDAKAYNRGKTGNEVMSAQDAETSTSKNLVLISNINAASEKDDYIYNNLAEVVEITNSNGRRLAFATPGNEEMASQEAKDDADPNVYTKKDRYQVREVDASIAQKVNFLTPTGGDKSYVVAAATVIVAVALIGITALIIKRYLLKAKL